MHRKMGISRVIKWLTVSGCVAIGLTWVVSLFVCLDFATGEPWYVTTHPGAIHIEECTDLLTARIVLREQLYAQFPVAWWFETSGDGNGNWSITVPFWVFFVPAAMLAAGAWRWHRSRCVQPTLGTSTVNHD